MFQVNHLLRRVVFGALAAIIQSTAQNPTIRNVPVCELMASPLQFHRVMVRVHLKLSRGYGDAEEQCPGKVKVGDRLFRKLAWIVRPGEDDKRFYSVDFTLDDKAHARLRGAERYAREHAATLYATVTGLIETRGHPLFYEYGFGPGEDAPIQIIAKDVTDFEISKPPSSKTK